MSENKKTRLDYLDIAKGLGILFVILGHIEYTPLPFRIWISTFHMPLFFVISGILLAVKDEPEKDFKDIYIKKARSILIPYFWFSLAFAVIDLGNLYLGKLDWTMYIYNQVSSLIFYGSGPLWFLPALFFAEIIFILMKKKLGDRITPVLLVILPFVASALEQPLDAAYQNTHGNMLVMMLINLARTVLRAVISAGFVGVAYYINKLAGRVIKKEKQGKLIPFVVGLVLVVILAFVCGYNDCADLHNMVLGNPILYFIFAYVGSYGILLISMGLPAIKLICYYGRNSLIIMAMHLNFYIVYAGIKVASYADVPIVKMFDTYTHPEWNELYVLIVIVVATFAICTIPIEIINRFMPFVMGRKKDNK